MGGVGLRKIRPGLLISNQAAKRRSNSGLHLVSASCDCSFESWGQQRRLIVLGRGVSTRVGGGVCPLETQPPTRRLTRPTFPMPILASGLDEGTNRPFRLHGAPSPLPPEPTGGKDAAAPGSTDPRVPRLSPEGLQPCQALEAHGGDSPGALPSPAPRPHTRLPVSTT